MSGRLREIAAKLDGADERLRKLKERVDRGAVTDLLAVSKYRDAEWACVRVDEVLDVPQEWHVWIGECVHDMRSALDRIAYSLNVAGSTDPPRNVEFSQFPLYTCRGKFEAMASRTAERSMVGCFPASAGALVEGIQPYHAGDNPDLSNTDIAQWLGVLVQLSNIDKHRHFPLTGVYPGFVSSPGSVEGHRVVTSVIRYEPLKPGADLMRLKVPDLPDGIEEPQVEFSYSCELQFEGEEAQPPLPLVLEQEPVDFVLGNILKAIRQSVLPAFEPLLK